MTNGEKYKTAKERWVAFKRFCSFQPHGCNECELSKCTDCECRFEWLNLEYKEELRPCPFCGRTPVMANNMESMRSLTFYVKCACGARFASTLSESAAADMWNRRAK